MPQFSPYLGFQCLLIKPDVQISRIWLCLNWGVNSPLWHQSAVARVLDGAPDLAEQLVWDHVDVYIDRVCRVACYDPTLFSTEELAEYICAYSQPGALRAGFHYYRAALEEDIEALTTCTQKLSMPVRAWGGERFMGDILPLWQEAAGQVEGGGVVERCSHFVAEERPNFVLQQVHEFFGPLQ